jgi:succinate dehydrogenase/fumarate reductase flavoprotein subunit
LLDIVIFGRACALKYKENLKNFLIFNFSILAQNKPGDPVPALPLSAGEASIENVNNLRNGGGGDMPTAQLRLEMQRTMQKHAAVFRTGSILQVKSIILKLFMIYFSGRN